MPEAAGTYQVIVRNQQGEDRQDLRIIVEPRRGRGRGGQPAAGAPQIQFQQQQYEIGYGEVIDIVPNIYVRLTKRIFSTTKKNHYHYINSLGWK